LALEPWSPQTQFLGIIGTGNEYGVASRGPMAIEGAYLWTLKDNIDNTWMDGYRGLGGSSGNGMVTVADAGGEPTVVIDREAEEALALSSMRCGGCGSKLGGKVHVIVSLLLLPVPSSILFRY
jgi:selenide, water dikinase